jgi:hypothetical protein
MSYLVKYDAFEKGERKSHIYIGNSLNSNINLLANYCKTLPERNKRYVLNHSYYFNTAEICFDCKN